MYYWNQENFDGLKSIGEEYRLKTGYDDFATYCFLKEKGIKREALKAIEKFINSVKKRSLEEQRKIAEEFAFLEYSNKNIHQLIPYPLRKFILEVFKDWAEEETDNIDAHRWLGYISNDLANFERALQINPTDEISIIELVKANLNYVDYQTHHLSESLFIGNINDAKSCLEKVLKRIERLKPGKLKDNMIEEYQYIISLVNIWEEYKQEHRTLSFPDWCQSKGKRFNFIDAIYYD